MCTDVYRSTRRKLKRYGSQWLMDSYLWPGPLHFNNEIWP